MKHRIVILADGEMVRDLERLRRSRALDERLPSFSEIVRQTLRRGLAVDTCPSVVSAPRVVA